MKGDARMASRKGTTFPSAVDDPWGEWRGDDDRPEAVEGEATRVTAPPLEDGVALSRDAIEDPDAT
jgi:hypothetical protein